MQVSETTEDADLRCDAMRCATRERPRLYVDTPLLRPASALDAVYLKQEWTATEDSPNHMSPPNLDGADGTRPAGDDVGAKLARKRYVAITSKQSSYRQPTALNE